MKKIGFFLLLFVLVPTISLSASSITIDECIDYMQNFTNNRINMENISTSLNIQNMPRNNNYMMNNYDNYMMNDGNDISDDARCH